MKTDDYLYGTDKHRFLSQGEQEQFIALKRRFIEQLINHRHAVMKKRPLDIYKQIEDIDAAIAFWEGV